MRSEALNLAPQLIEQNKSIYLRVWAGKGWIINSDGNPQVIDL